MKQLFPGLEMGRPTWDACQDGIRLLAAEHGGGSRFVTLHGGTPAALGDALRQALASGDGNVTVVGVLGSPEADGGPALAGGDLAAGFGVPDVAVVVPADAAQMTVAVRACFEHPGPIYLRADARPSPVVYREAPAMEIGRADTVREGTDVTLVVTGLMVAAALVAHERLGEMGVWARVLNLSTIRPLDTDAVAAAARETGAIVTAAEHGLRDGLGSAVARVLSNGHPVPMENLGLADGYDPSGDPAQVLLRSGLTAAHIMGAAHDVLGRKTSPGGDVRRSVV